MDIAKKLEIFILGLMKDVPVEMKLESCSERGANDIHLGIESVSLHIDQRIEDFTIGKGINYAKESQFSSNISEYLFNASVINVQRTQIIHVDSPAKFFIKYQLSKINQMELNKCANIMTDASTIDMKTVYLVQKSNDMNWYRAKVLATTRDENDFIMIFIDHGYKYAVNKSK